MSAKAFAQIGCHIVPGDTWEAAEFGENSRLNLLGQDEVCQLSAASLLTPLESTASW